MASPGILLSSHLQNRGIFKNPSISDTADSSPSSSPLEAFASDPIFSAFLSPEFDSVRFSSQTLISGSTAALAEYLRDFIRLLQGHLRTEEGDPLLTERVWEALVKTFASQIKSDFAASSFSKDAFTHKVVLCDRDLLERISRGTNMKGVLPALSPEGKEQLVAAINIYLALFLSSDIVNIIFTVSNCGCIPSKEQISRIILHIQEEIEVVRIHGHLILFVLHEIGKVLLLLAERAECQISTGPLEACQVTGPAMAAQVKNFALCQHLPEIHARVSHTTSPLPAVASDVLSSSLGVIYGVACDFLTSLFKAMLDQLESCILQIHEQDYGSERDRLNVG